MTPVPRERKRRTTGKRPVDPDAGLLKALSHPLRWRMLHRLNEVVASPVMLARELEISIPLAAYHVKILRDLDCVELVRTQPRRGATEHHYRATRRAFLDERQWGALAAAQRGKITGAILREAMMDALGALHGGTIDSRDDRVTLFTPLLLDPQAWSELNDLLDSLHDRALELHAESAGRTIEGSDDRIRSTLTLLHYEAAPHQRRGDAAGT